MKRTVLILTAVLIGAAGFGHNAAAETEVRIGAGAHYWRTVDDIKDQLSNGDTKFVESSIAWLGIVQIWPVSLIGFEGTLEILPDGIGENDSQAYAPQAYLMVGGGVYAAVGIGTYYVDGSMSDPFYSLRAGIDMELFRFLHVDINANYRFVNWDELSSDDITTSTITVGASALIEF